MESLKTKKYVIRIIQNVSIDQYRKNQRESGKVIPITEVAENYMHGKRDEVEEMLSDIGNREQVEQLLAKLPYKYRKVIKYRILADLSVTETASVLGG